MASRSPEILNHYVNFGWEYVWHCHILSHEEMDMMHSLVFAVPPKTPTGLVRLAVTGPANNPTVNLTWIDNSLKEARFTIQRATDANFTMGLATFNRVNSATTVPSTVTFADTPSRLICKYWYRVFAIGNTVGDTQAYTGSAGFPTMSIDSVSNTYSRSWSGPQQRRCRQIRQPDGNRANRTAGEPDVDGHREQRDRLCGRALHRSRLHCDP